MQGIYSISATRLVLNLRERARQTRPQRAEDIRIPELTHLEFAPRPSYEISTHSIEPRPEDVEMLRIHKGERDLERGDETEIVESETRSLNVEGREGNRGERSDMLWRTVSPPIGIERVRAGVESGVELISR
jgi:hypothetical protein